MTNFEYAIGDPITVDAQPFFRTISASGVWGPGPGTPDTPFSQPDASWSFSFDLPNPISSNPTNQATNFSYVTNGNAVSDTLFMPFVAVKFFSAPDAGMFDLTFSNGDVLSLYGADIGTSLTLAPGQYDVAAGMQMHPASGIGTVTVSSTRRSRNRLWSRSSPRTIHLGDDGSRVCGTRLCWLPHLT